MVTTRLEDEEQHSAHNPMFVCGRPPRVPTHVMKFSISACLLACLSVFALLSHVQAGFCDFKKAGYYCRVIDGKSIEAQCRCMGADEMTETVCEHGCKITDKSDKGSGRCVEDPDAVSPTQVSSSVAVAVTLVIAALAWGTQTLQVTPTCKLTKGAWRFIHAYTSIPIHTPMHPYTHTQAGLHPYIHAQAYCGVQTLIQCYSGGCVVCGGVWCGVDSIL